MLNLFSALLSPSDVSATPLTTATSNWSWKNGRSHFLARRHWFELHDQPWCPNIIRESLTEWLRALSYQFKIHETLAPLLQQLMLDSRTTQMVDLCSGGGGPLLPLEQSMEAIGQPVSITVTDKFPNREAFTQLEQSTKGKIKACFTPVDATSVPRNLPGMRTLFNSFHHFRPNEARSILADAYHSRQPIAIFEITERAFVKTLLCPFATFLAVLWLMPQMRPMRLSWWLLTYVVPLLPITIAWDGLVSHLRSYSLEEMQHLTSGIADDSYGWSTNRFELPDSTMQITSLVGKPIYNPA